MQTQKKLTHHDTTVEALGSYGDYDITAVPFEHFATRYHEAVSVPRFFALVVYPNAFLIADLPDRVGLAGCTALVTAHIVARQEDAIAGDNFARFNQRDVSYNNVMDVDDAFGSIANNLDPTFLFLLVQSLELSLLLPVVK